MEISATKDSVFAIYTVSTGGGYSIDPHHCVTAHHKFVLTLLEASYSNSLWALRRSPKDVTLNRQSMLSSRDRSTDTRAPGRVGQCTKSSSPTSHHSLRRRPGSIRWRLTRHQHRSPDYVHWMRSGRVLCCLLEPV